MFQPFIELVKIEETIFNQIFKKNSEIGILLHLPTFIKINK